MSRRRMRTQAEWNVEAHTSLAAGPRRAASRSFNSPAALLVKVMAMISHGRGRPRHRAGGPGEPPHRLADPGSAPKVQILLRGPVGDLVAVAAPAIGQKVVDPLDEHGGLAAARPASSRRGPRWSWPLDAAWGSAGPDPGRSPLSGRSHTVVQSQSYCSPFSLFSQTDLYFTAKSGRGQRRNRRFFRIRFVIKLRLTFVYLFATLMV